MSAAIRRESYAGFTLLEVLIAMVVLSIGVLSLAAMLGDGLAYMGMAQYDYIAQQKAAEAVESIYTARDTGQTTWANINNVSNGGLFVNGQTQLCDPGTDGIVGTADDNCAKPDSIILPGPDGKLGTADDVFVPLQTFRRTITIADVPNRPGLRTITVVINYTAGRFQRSYTLNTNISQFS